MATEPLEVSREPNQTEITVRRYKSWGVFRGMRINTNRTPSVPPGIASGRKPPSPCTLGFSAISDLAKPPTFLHHFQVSSTPDSAALVT